MFFFFPIFNSILVLYLLAAIIPAVFLLRYIYKMDRVDKESPQLLLSLLVRGVAAALAAGLNTFCQMPEGDRLAMAEKEKAYASHHFSLDQQLADIGTAYEAALDSKKG